MYLIKKIKNQNKNDDIFRFFAVLVFWLFYFFLFNTNNNFLFFISQIIIFGCLTFLISGSKINSLGIPKIKISKFIVFIVIFSGLIFCSCDALLRLLGIKYDLNWFSASRGIAAGFLKNSYYYSAHAFIFGPLIEEFVFRRNLLVLLVKNTVPYASLIVSILFVCFHISNSFSFYVFIFLFSIQVNQLFLRTGNYYLCVLFHSASNIGVNIFYKISQLINPGLYLFMFYFSLLVLGMSSLIVLNLYLVKFEALQKKLLKAF